MSISLICTACGKRLRARDEQVGKRLKCPGCGQLLPPTPPPAPTQPAGAPDSSRQAPRRNWLLLSGAGIGVGVCLVVAVVAAYFLLRGGGHSDGGSGTELSGGSAEERIAVVMPTFFGNAQVTHPGQLELFALGPTAIPGGEKKPLTAVQLDRMVDFFRQGGQWGCRLVLSADFAHEKEWTILLLGPKSPPPDREYSLGAFTTPGKAPPGLLDFFDLPRADAGSTRAFLERFAAGIDKGEVSARFAKTAPLESRQRAELAFRPLTGGQLREWLNGIRP
jgi:hypothetical protein